MSSNNSLPPSVLLDRLKNFLPQIAKANEELEEKIKKDGREAVIIDTNMAPSNDDSAENDDSSDTEKNLNANDDESKPIVQIEFALGDFDNSAIANIEENNESSVKKPVTQEDDEDSD